MKNDGPDEVLVELPNKGCTSSSPKWFLLLVIPLLVGCVGFQMRHAAGPFWLGTNCDPAYPYLLNSLSLAQFHPPFHTDHPGTTLQLLGALIVRVTHWLAGTGTLETDLIAQPEFYLTAIWIVSLATLVVILFGIALWVLRATGDASAAFLLQVPPLLSATCFSELSRVTPEIVLLTLSCALGAVVFIHIRRPGSLTDGSLAMLGGILVGLAMATKLTAIPMGLVPFLVLREWGLRVRYCLFTLGTFIVVMIPVMVGGKFRATVTWIYGLITHTGIYGSGSAGLIDVARYQESMMTLLRDDPSLCAAVLIGLGILGWSSSRFVPTPNSDACQMMRRGLLALTGVQILQILLVAKHPAGRYLLPALGLLGLNLALIAGIIQETVQGSLRSVGHVFAGLMIVTLLTFQAPQYLWQKTALTNEKLAQLKTSMEMSRHQGSKHLYSLGCSSETFALLFGNWFANWRFAQELTKRFPDAVCHHPFSNFYYNAFGQMSSEGFLKNHSPIVCFGAYLEQDSCDLASDLKLLHAPSREGLRFNLLGKIYEFKTPRRHVEDQPGVEKKRGVGSSSHPSIQK